MQSPNRVAGIFHIPVADKLAVPDAQLGITSLPPVKHTGSNGPRSVVNNSAPVHMQFHDRIAMPQKFEYRSRAIGRYITLEHTIIHVACKKTPVIELEISS